MSLADFAETRINLGVNYGAVGGPQYLTTVVAVNSGHEHRNSAWAKSRGRWQLGEKRLNRAEIDYLLAFFRARRGRAQGFRFKDWSDFRFNESGLWNGGKLYQVTKTYASGSDTYARELTKLVSGPFAATLNSSPFATYTLDNDTGILTLTTTPTKSIAITGITQANPGVVTAVAHGFTTGQEAYLTGAGGMTQVNGKDFTVTVLTADTFSIGVNTSSYAAYTSGGTANQYLASSDTLAWSGEFDVPVRFDTDEFQSEFQAYRDEDGEGLYWLTSLPIAEIRI